MNKLLPFILLPMMAGAVQGQETTLSLNHPPNKTTEDTPGEVLGLNEAIEAALEHNHQLQIREIESEKAENLATRGNAGLLPSVSLTSGFNWSYYDQELVPGDFFENLRSPEPNGQQERGFTYDGVSAMDFNAGIELQYILFDGFRGRHRYQLLQTGSDIADLSYLNELQETMVEVTRKYSEASSLQESIRLQEIALEQSLDRYEIISARQEYGEANEQQVLQAEADLKSDSVAYRDLTHQFKNAYRDLHQSIGWDEVDMIPLQSSPEPSSVPDYETLKASLQERNTAINIREKRIKRAESELEIAKSSSRPTLKSSAQYGYSYHSATEGQFETQEQLGFTGGLTLSIPLYTGGQNRTTRENARASVRQEQLYYEESRKEIETIFDNSWEYYRHLKDQLSIEKANKEVYERNFIRAEDFFERGLISGLEFREAQLSLLSARQRITETEMQLKVAETNLLYLSGQLMGVQ